MLIYILPLPIEQYSKYSPCFVPQQLIPRPVANFPGKRDGSLRRSPAVIDANLCFSMRFYIFIYKCIFFLIIYIYTYMCWNIYIQLWKSTWKLYLQCGDSASKCRAFGEAEQINLSPWKEALNCPRSICRVQNPTSFVVWCAYIN